jgi:hypothetical protein
METLKSPIKSEEIITVQYKGGMSSAEKSRVRKSLREFKSKQVIDGFVSCTEESDIKMIDTLEEETIIKDKTFT